MFWLPLLLVGFTPALPAANSDMPVQAARGKGIFFDAANKTHCSTCHELEKQGTAVGPDLTKVGRLSPRAVLISMLSTRTVYVKEVELKTKNKFPAMIVSENGNEVKLYDLSKMPPEPMTLEKSAIYAVRDNGTWKHPPESAGLSAEQLADVISYIRWVAFGDTKGVSPDEVKQ
jgi:mono/diheme cytochrome c family protein